MQTDPFFEELESELAPFTDEQVDAISSATESDIRYRVEIFGLYGLAVLAPTSVLFLGFYLIRVGGAAGVWRVAFLLAMLVAVFSTVRAVNLVSGRYARWRYQAAFLRQLAAAKARAGR